MASRVSPPISPSPSTPSIIDQPKKGGSTDDWLSYTAERHVILRHIHITSALLSVSLFSFRALLMLRSSPLLHRRILHAARDIIDSLLLGSAIYMAKITQQYPYPWGSKENHRDWLTAKQFALIGYIVAGTVALKRGKTMRIKKIALGVSMGSIIYMVGVATTRDPLLGYSYRKKS